MAAKLYKRSDDIRDSDSLVAGKWLMKVWLGKKWIDDTEEGTVADKNLRTVTHPDGADFGWTRFLPAPVTHTDDTGNQILIRVHPGIT